MFDSHNILHCIRSSNPQETLVNNPKSKRINFKILKTNLFYNKTIRASWGIEHSVNVG